MFIKRAVFASLVGLNVATIHAQTFEAKRCEFLLDHLNSPYLVVHGAPVDGAKADFSFLELKTFLNGKNEMLHDALGPQYTIHKLGHGYFGDVYRLIGTNGKSLVVKHFRTWETEPVASQVPERERRKLEILSNFFYSHPMATVVKPLHNEGSFLFLEDIAGISLQKYVDNDANSHRAKTIAIERYRALEMHVKKLLPNWSESYGYEVQMLPSSSIHFSLKKDGVRMEFLLKPENVLIRPDGSLVVIDPF